ncbi:kinetochore-associated protein 1-like [Aphidius gifuensis]|uniref:kinetochore-associated protein 1-like n=1 Tax=Aphidius gifuensis TaxID=684658 RepID=UPI001CDD6075|nr:kinetochore-associated protein 1-like [Aphidius gifuensis]
MSNLNYKFKKIQFFNNYQSAICLRMDGSLNILCLQTLLSRKIWKNCIDDFISIKEDLEGPYHILILMKPDDITNKKKLHLLSFPDFKIKFTIVVENTTYLVDIINNKTDNENLLFLEGIKTTNEYVDLIRIKAIEESIPELRLQRLLRKYKFNEALDFALKFNLDCEIVYHAEAMMLMEKLRPRLQSSEKIDVDIFMTTLDKIKDVKFIYECCNNAMTKDYKDTRKLLVYSRQRIVDYVNDKNIQDKLNENLSQLLATVSDTLRKLETFEMIHKADVINETSTDEWIKFSRENLLKECMEYLSNSELNSASLIWTRHMSSIASIVTSETIIDILAAIPENLSPDELWPWLIHFIPSVTSLIPNGLSEIINWGYKKTKTLEKYHRDLWPDIGLEFANGFINILQFEENNIYYQFHQEYTNKNSQLQRLMLLIQAMKDLRDLKTNYKIFLPLHTYLGNSTDVIHLLLNKVNINELPNLLDNFLHVYMLNNSLKNDHVLSSYVQNILKNSKGWWLWEKAPWDKRLSIVINYIHNIQNRLQQTLEVLKRAPVPWSDEVKLLAEKSYNYDHPLVAKIRIESNSVVVKLILKKYRYAHIGLSSRFFSYIIKQNRSTMIDDIIELTKMNNTTRFNVFSECVNYHLTQAIQNEHHDFALLKIITNISIILSSLVPSIDDIIQDIHDVLNHCVIMMLKKVIVSINFDVQLGLVCLLMIPHDNSLKTLGLISKLHQADYKRDRIIKDLGYEYCRLTKNYQQMEEFNMMKIRYEWAKRLANYKITYREIMSNDVDIKHDILRRIMSSNENNIIDTLNDYCLSFGFVRDDVYLAYLESLLCSWEPKYIINNQNGQKEPIIDDNDINCMKIPESYTHATAALYYAVNYMPPGADQVEAAKECFSYINNLPEGTIDIDNDKRIKIENKYRKYTSKHILHTYGLGDDKYLNLVDYPEQLVRALYYDKTIPERYRCATKNRPDINSSVNDLGKVFNINLVKIRLELLEEWLQPDTGEIKNDSITVAGICQDDTSSSLIDTFTFDDNLLRACYIISCGDHEQFIGHLITMGLTEDFHCPGVRYRALRVVQSITDENTIQELSKINSSTMNEYLKSLQYLTDLQRLGIGYSISGFDSCSKEKLIQVLISNQYCCSRSLRLVPQLFIDYHIDNYELLNFVNKLKFFDIIHSCFRAQQPHFAAALLPFVEDTDKQLILNEISLNYHDIDSVIKKLKKIEKKRIVRQVSYLT